MYSNSEDIRGVYIKSVIFGSLWVLTCVVLLYGGPDELVTEKRTLYSVEMLAPVIDHNTLICRAPHGWGYVIPREVATF